MFLGDCVSEVVSKGVTFVTLALKGDVTCSFLLQLFPRAALLDCHGPIVSCV